MLKRLLDKNTKVLGMVFKKSVIGIKELLMIQIDSNRRGIKHGACSERNPIKRTDGFYVETFILEGN
jgi:hypothetical protein